MNFEWSSFCFVYSICCGVYVVFLCFCFDQMIQHFYSSCRIVEEEEEEITWTGNFPESFTICVASVSICLPTNVSTIFRLFSSVSLYFVGFWWIEFWHCLLVIFSSLDRCVIEFFGWLHYFSRLTRLPHTTHAHTNKTEPSMKIQIMLNLYSSKQRFFCLLLFLF